MVRTIDHPADGTCHVPWYVPWYAATKKVFSCVIRQQLNQQSPALLNTSATTSAYLVKTRSTSRKADSLDNEVPTPRIDTGTDVDDSPPSAREVTWEYADDRAT